MPVRIHFCRHLIGFHYAGKGGLSRRPFWSIMREIRELFARTRRLSPPPGPSLGPRGSPSDLGGLRRCPKAALVVLAVHSAHLEILAVDRCDEKAGLTSGSRAKVNSEFCVGVRGLFQRWGFFRCVLECNLILSIPWGFGWFVVMLIVGEILNWVEMFGLCVRWIFVMNVYFSWMIRGIVKNAI